MRTLLTALIVGATCAVPARGEDGYRLWLRYAPTTDSAQRKVDASLLREIVFVTPTGADSPTLDAAREELKTGLRELLGAEPDVVTTKDPSAVAGAAGAEGYSLRTANRAGFPAVIVAAHADVGILYGVFALLRQVQTGRPLEHLAVVDAPKIQRRILDHWDNLDGTIERGFAGNSLWDWFDLPDYASPRLRDYARANASIGINGAVLNNVNADALVLTPNYLEKVAKIADVFRPYGIRVYLSARFSAPIELGGLKTADPLDPGVIGWWRAKTDEIYRAIPDFGGFLVKANSEGQPGPQNYGRTHADGANLIADAVAPHGGIVLWRAFVYQSDPATDRIKQAYLEFKPLDGAFRPNVVIQVKNGPFDFQPREPVHPLFGAMPHTALGLEFQITQEYLGQGIHLAYLGPLFQECLDWDTFSSGPGSTVARIVDGTLDHRSLTVIAGVANTGDDRDWTGHPLSAANWYAFGRLAWDHTLTAATIADEWTRMTFSNDPRVVQPIAGMLLASREAVVDYMDPLGLAGIFALGHHYGPEPWLDQGRPDWTSVYYHRADAVGLGFDRTATGSNAVSQYAPPLAQRFGDLATCPENLLLWFHHVPWDHRLASGRTMWDEFCLHYQRGVDEVASWDKSWESVQGLIDPERFEHVQALLRRQAREARGWRDACLLYFQTFSRRPLPRDVAPPEHPLDYYQAIQLRNLPGHPVEK